MNLSKVPVKVIYGIYEEEEVCVRTPVPVIGQVCGLDTDFGVDVVERGGGDQGGTSRSRQPPVRGP
ncbi:hypothetical protein K435DRAFT_870775 [Dendrothele bispora CBS 962.96]|uniref:Uncharacterized protein n=1 Tax=Dendrothele bispora (strain CBS 962.96) TaxID=1314807 RepID=A0A4S8L686_DENBC|nr:hypothetical protein K435DRAFT_870775 [Dendrothele bispora CBS 962.96]